MSIKAWLGFAWDVAKIIYGQDWDDAQTNEREPDNLEQATVILTPQARTMVARPTPPPCPTDAPPLEGSVEARRICTDRGSTR